MVDRYNIRLELKYVNGQDVKIGRIRIMKVKLVDKDNVRELILSNKEAIKDFLNQKYDAKQQAEAERQHKIDSIEGLQIFRDTLNDIENWHAEFQKSFDDVDSLGVHQRPQHDLVELKQKYPRAAAYLQAESWEYAENYVKSAAGRKAKGKIINGKDYIEAIEDMKAEWEEYIKDH